jgi:hypothetical protein
MNGRARMAPMKRSDQAEEIEKLKARIGDLEALLKKHKKDWQGHASTNTMLEL